MQLGALAPTTAVAHLIWWIRIVGAQGLAPDSMVKSNSQF